MTNVDRPAARGTLAGVFALAVSLQLAGCATKAGTGQPSALHTAQAQALYAERCATCHEAGLPRALNLAGLQGLSAERIRLSLTAGVMSEVGRGLTPSQIEALSRHLGKAPVTAATQPASGSAPCGAATAWPADALAAPHWNGWGADATQARAQPAAMAQLAAADVPRLKLKWAVGMPETVVMNAQPTVVAGHVFVGGPSIQSLDAASGCRSWEFKPDAPVRSAITIGPGPSGTWNVYFGDLRANLYAVEAATGALRWRVALDAHPAARITGAPTLFENRLYVPMSSIEEASAINPRYACCTFRGSVSAVDAATGKVLWKRHTIADEPKPLAGGGGPRFGPSGAAIWSAPTVDPVHRRLYVTTSNGYSDPAAATANAILAIDLDSGAIAWSRQMTPNDAYNMGCRPGAPGRGNCPAAKGPDVDFGSSALLVTLAGGRRVLVAGQKSGVVHALDPERNGEVLWQTRIGLGGTLGGVQWGMASDGRLVYAALSDVRLELASKDTPGAQPALGTHLRLVPNVGGGMYALDAQSGQVVWHTPHPGCRDKPGCSPAQSAAVTLIPGIVFSGGLDGHLRAYDVRDGRVVWDLDTAREYAPTVNGVAARGGSLDGPGVVVVGGTLYMVSGYAVFGGMPGNALLALSIDAR